MQASKDVPMVDPDEEDGGEMDIENSRKRTRDPPGDLLGEDGGEMDMENSRKRTRGPPGDLLGEDGGEMDMENSRKRTRDPPGDLLGEEDQKISRDPPGDLLGEEDQKISGRESLSELVIDSLKNNLRIINPLTHKLADREISVIIKTAKSYDVDTRKTPEEEADDAKYHERLIDAIARKKWTTYNEGRGDLLKDDDKEIIERHMDKVNKRKLARGPSASEKSWRPSPHTTGQPLTEEYFKTLEVEFLKYMVEQGKGDHIKKSSYDPNRINVRTREKIYELFLFLFEKSNKFSDPHGVVMNEPKNILALTLLLSYGSRFFNCIIVWLTTMLEGEFNIKAAIDPHAETPIISRRFRLSPNQFVRGVSDVERLLSETKDKIEAEADAENTEYFASLKTDVTIQQGDNPWPEQLIAILDWGVVVHGKASKATYQDPSLLAENDHVNRGVMVAQLTPMKIGLEGIDGKPVYSGPFALAEREIELEPNLFVYLLRVLNGGLSDKLIGLFVLYSILSYEHKMKIINSLEVIPPRQLQTPEGEKGLSIPQINSDEFLLPFLGMDFKSEAYKAIKKDLNDKEKRQQYNEKIWGLYFMGEPILAIEWLNKNIKGFKAAYELDEKKKIEVMHGKADLWYKEREDGPWLPVSPEVFVDNSKDGYKTPEEIFRALFQGQSAIETKKALKNRDKDGRWGPVLWGKKGVKAAFSKKKKKKKKKKKPIRTEKRKKPSKKETKAQRERRLRKQKESRRKERQKKEKKSKKKNRTNRKKRKDRTIRIGDSVEIHYN
jgi:hypothetical protein